MKEVFIPDTSKRYSITEEGIIYSLYRHNNKGGVIYQRKMVKPYSNGGNSKHGVVNIIINGKYKAVGLVKLMEKCFNLQPPDSFHYYDLLTKDGDFYNVSLNNLEYRIRTLNCKYYPEPYYDKYGNIFRKKCGSCGEVKNIDEFNLQEPRKKNQQKTYRNSCKTCLYKGQWEVIKSDESMLKRHRESCKRWEKSEKGQQYRSQYTKDRSQYEKNNVTDRYVHTSLRLYKYGIKLKEVNPLLIELGRKRILLRRKIIENQNQ